MLLVVCKHGGQWDFLAKMFGIEGSTFEQLTTKFLKSFLAVVFGNFVYFCREYYTMLPLLEDKTDFKSCKQEKYGTVTPYS